MEDDEFFDLLYQQWAKTTGAEAKFWMPELDDDEHIPWQIFAVDEDQEKQWIGSVFKEADADWITAVHGCLGDLIRRLHTALDEAERFNREKDDLTVQLAELAEENNDLRAQLRGDVVG